MTEQTARAEDEAAKTPEEAAAEGTDGDRLDCESPHPERLEDVGLYAGLF